MPDTFLKVDGAFELQRAFSLVSKNLGSGVKEALEAGAEPVRRDASNLARTNISGMARVHVPWWRMRVGVTRHSVYIAPEQRGVKSGRINERRRRPNLKSVMRPQMDQGLAQNRERVVLEVQREIGELIRRWGRNG